MIEWEQKSKPKKSLGLPTKPPKIPGPKITPQKIPCRISELKNFQKGLSDITRKKNTRN